MNYGELVAEVQTIVPSTAEELLIRSKLNQIIRYISSSGYYWRAFTEVTINDTDGVDATANIQNISLDDTFRRLLYCSYPESISSDIIQVLDVVSVNNLRKGCKDLENTAYLTANGLRINNANKTAEFNLGYWQHPANFATDGTEDTNTNWLTTAVPNLIIDLTSAYLMNLIGANEDSTNVTRIVQAMQISQLRDQVNEAISE